MIALRPASAEDREFLRAVFTSTRTEEVGSLGWDEQAIEAFLRMQFDAQDRAYHESYPDARFDLVIVDGLPAGRLYVDRRSDRIHVIEIALLPDHRSAGIGTELLRALLDEGRASGKSVTVNALMSGRALALYRRLGFEVTHADEIYADLEWRPDQANTAS